MLQLWPVPLQTEGTIGVFGLGGVFEKSPRLKIVSAENDVAWMPYLMYRIDSVQNRLGAIGGLELPVRASDYIKRNVYATFFADPVFVDSLLRKRRDYIIW